MLITVLTFNLEDYLSFQKCDTSISTSEGESKKAKKKRPAKSQESQDEALSSDDEASITVSMFLDS